MSHGPPQISDVERDVSLKLESDLQVDTRCYELYRRHSWKSALGGKMFCEDLDITKNLRSIKEA
jgi:hypothetical protein